MTKLHTLKISSYRSCHETALTFHPNLSVLIGPNGSGKTNILYSILLLKHLLRPRRRFYSLNKPDQDPDVPLVGLESTFDIDGNKLKHTASLQLDIDE